MSPLDPEARDALRLELQESSPQERERFEELIKETYDDFLTSWGEYVQKPIENEEIADRFFDVSDDMYRHVRPDWMGKEHRDGKMATTDVSAGIVFMRRAGTKMHAVYKRLPEDFRARLWESNGYRDNAEAVQRLTESFERNVAAHEIAHLLQDPSMPASFKEVGALWYGQELEHQHERMIIEDKDANKKMKIYADLLSLHGDIVHKMFFGVEDVTGEEADAVFSAVPEERIREAFGVTNDGSGN